MILPGAVGVTLTVTVTWAPLAIPPRLQRTGSVPPQDPCVAVTAPRMTPAGRLSVSLTSVALPGPLFRITRV